MIGCLGFMRLNTRYMVELRKLHNQAFSVTIDKCSTENERRITEKK